MRLIWIEQNVKLNKNADLIIFPTVYIQRWVFLSTLMALSYLMPPSPTFFRWARSFGLTRSWICVVTFINQALGIVTDLLIFIEIRLVTPCPGRRSSLLVLVTLLSLAVILITIFTLLQLTAGSGKSVEGDSSSTELFHGGSSDTSIHSVSSTIYSCHEVTGMGHNFRIWPGIGSVHGFRFLRVGI